MPLRYCLMFFTLSGAGACAFMGAREYSLAAQSSQEPEVISLRDLVRRGPAGNPNIILTDFAILDDYVYKSKFGSGRWTKVWVPIIPTDGDDDAPGRPAAIRAFLFSTDITGDSEVHQRFDRPRLRGMVNPDAPKPGILGSVIIEKSYPGTDTNRCLIIEEGKEPAGVLKLGLFGAGCVLLLGLSGTIWYLARRMDQVDAAPAAGPPPPARKRQDDAETILDALPVKDAD